MIRRISWAAAACVLSAFLVWGAGSASAAGTTIDSYSLISDVTVITDCDGNQGSQGNQDNSAPASGHGPFTLHLSAASPQAAHSSCVQPGFNATASASSTLDAGGRVDANSGVLTLDYTGQGSGTATVANSSGPHCARANTIEAGGGLVTFTITQPQPFSFQDASAFSPPDPDAAVNAILTDQSSHQIFSQTVGTSLSGTLPAGTYTLNVEANARSIPTVTSSSCGNTSVTSTLTVNSHFRVGAAGPCPGGVSSVQVGVALASGCFTERKDVQGNGTGVFETDQEAWVGGFDLMPQSGGKLVLEPGNRGAPIRAEGSGVDWVLHSNLSVPAPLSELKPFTPSYTLSLNTAGTLERLLALPLIKDTSAQVTVTWAPGGGGATVQGQLSIEDLSKNLGTAFSEATGRTVGTLAGSLTLTLANQKPLSLSGASLQVPEFSVNLKDTDPPLRLGFGGAKFTEADDASGKPTWSAEVTALFPWADRQGSVNAGLSFADSSLSALKLGVTGFKIALGKTGWDWTGANGQIAFLPTLGFDVGINTEEHAKVAGDPIFKLDGNVKGLQLAVDCKNGTNPFEFLLSGTAPPLETAHIGKATFQVRFCAYVPSVRNFAFEAGLSGSINVDVGFAKKLVTATGSATGWFSGTDFNLDGTYQLQLPIIGNIGAVGLLSSEGYGFCGTYHFITEGFATNNWVVRPVELTGCDLTPFRAPTHAADIAAAGQMVRVAGGQNLVAIAVRGATGAPRVRVLGPHGERFTTPAGVHGLTTARAIILPIDQLRTTYVYLHKPQAGVWRIVTLPGSIPITRLDTARQLPKPRVSAALRVKAGKVRLTWSALPIAGQKIQLIDRAAGTAAKVQPLTGKHSGSVTFTPADPLATRRMIEADVFERGMPRAHLIVARYRLHAAKPPGRVTHAVATRGGSGLTLSWHKASRARNYLVTVSSGTRVVTAFDTTRTRVTLTSAPAGPLSVRIEPHDAAGRAGPATRLLVA